MRSWLLRSRLLRSRLEWLGLVARMPDHKLPKKKLHNKTEVQILLIS